jgi:hypothetical protein
MHSSRKESFFENKDNLHKTLCHLGLVESISVLEKRKEFIDRYSSYPYSSFLDSRDFEWIPKRLPVRRLPPIVRTIPALTQHPREMQGQGALNYHIPETIQRQRKCQIQPPEILLPIHSQNLHDMSKKSKEAYLRTRREWQMSVKMARMSGRLPLPDPPPPKFQIVYASDRKVTYPKKS